MNLKPILRYQLRQFYDLFSVYYPIIYVIILLGLMGKYARGNAFVSFSGMEGLTILVCFVAGIVLFKGAFRFFTSCGVSRRRLFCGLTAAIAVTAAAVSLLDMINVTVFSNFIEYRTCYWSMVSGGSPFVTFLVPISFGSGKPLLQLLSFSFFLKNWLWCLLADFALAMLGFFIAVLYYRMNKPVKILVSVGVPAVCFLLLPMLNTSVAHGQIAWFIAAVSVRWSAWGLNPVLDLSTRLAAIAVLGGFTWLLFRKAELYR